MTLTDKQQADEAEFTKLTAEYETWMTANGVTLGSADEHLFDESLTKAQRDWLLDFTQRWESVGEEE